MESECMGTKGGLRAKKRSGVKVRTWAARWGAPPGGSGLEDSTRKARGPGTLLSFSAGVCAKLLRGRGHRVPLRRCHRAGAWLRREGAREGQEGRLTRGAGSEGGGASEQPRALREEAPRSSRGLGVRWRLGAAAGSEWGGGAGWKRAATQSQRASVDVNQLYFSKT